ncbi:MAG: 30S ribosomal protein S13 [Chloroflexi bacterium]|nr:30S ribosomal protein S13 [Chloroflexota bacterium]
MAIIAGVNISDNLRVVIGLTGIYGIGPKRATNIAANLGIASSTRMRDLSDEDLAAIRNSVERAGIAIEGDLRRENQMNVRRLVEIQSYRGLRHRRGLPVRGQRTKTNARTKRGRRQTVAGKRRAPSH